MTRSTTQVRQAAAGSEQLRNIATLVGRAVPDLPPHAVATLNSEIEEVVDRLRSRIDELRAEREPSEDDLFPATQSVLMPLSPEEEERSKTLWRHTLKNQPSYRTDALAQLGNVLTPREVAARLGVSSATVNNMRNRSDLLGVGFDSHQFVYPVWQFSETPSEGERGILRYFGDALRAIGDSHAWEKAQFFLTPAPAAGGRRPIDVLRSGRQDDAEIVLECARRRGEMGS